MIHQRGWEQAKHVTFVQALAVLQVLHVHELSNYANNPVNRRYPHISDWEVGLRLTVA